jgi:hypothetical protein
MPGTKFAVRVFLRSATAEYYYIEWDAAAAARRRRIISSEKIEWRTGFG